MSEYLIVCEEAARLGGQVLRDWQYRISAREKGPRDLVTEADLASQQVIRARLLEQYPSHLFLGEEDDPRTGGGRRSWDELSQSDTYCWVVDPLDGTMNYVHGMPGFAVTLALLRGGRTVAGVVYDPLLDECFAASCGEGASLNGRRLKSSGCKSLENAMLAASFSPNVPRESPEVARFVELLHTAQAIRRLGSAALNLCYVAAGRLDGYWATSVKIWDVAAGLLMIEEAGGVATNLEGGELDLADPKLVVSATSELHQEVLASLDRAVAISGMPF